MKVLKSWLKDYVDIDIANDELAEKLSVSGTLVEAVGVLIDPKVIVGEIKDIKAHPNADRLQIAVVYNGEADLQIVCGAPNIAVGQKVPLAQIGAVLPEGEIRQAELRGIESFGMMCSERELGLGDDHGAIKILPSEFEVGRSLSEYLDADAIFELEITPNRGDCLSHLGIAREIAVITDKVLKKNIILKDTPSGQKLEVKIENKDLCSQYHAMVIEGVKVDESPEWLKNRLIALGQKSINNIVDITNFVMFDMGQPLHAFDYKKIEGKKIIVRTAKNEKIKSLDGADRNLDDKMLVIADSQKPIAIAGVMGGENSEVDQNTTDIVLESAEFLPQSVRKTAKQLNISTEASYRFERTIDSGSVKLALFQAAKMIQDIAGGKITDIKFDGQIPQKQSIKIEYDKINELLGLNLKNGEIDNILKTLGFEIDRDVCQIPLWRHDISIWQDLVEEVGRIYGLEKIKAINLTPSSAPRKSDFYRKEYLKDVLTAAGLTETLTYPFLSQDDLKIAMLETKDLLEVSNPIQKENKYLRNSLIPGLLQAVAKNPSFEQVFLFEIGNVFTKVTEITNLSIVTSGKGAKENIENAIKAISGACQLNDGEFAINELLRDELIRYKIKKPVTYFAEIELAKIIDSMNLTDEDLELKINSANVLYRQVSKYPAVVRDLAFILDKDIDSGDVEKQIVETSDEILLIEKFDEFSSNKFGQNKKNVAFHLWFQNLNKTIDEAEIGVMMQLIINKVEKHWNAKLRS